MSAKAKFCDPEPMLKRKIEDRRAFLALPPKEAQRRIKVGVSGPLVGVDQEDPIFTTDLEGDACLD